MGLSASVADTSGEQVCDVSIEIRDGSYSEQKQLAPTDCTFSGAGERPGTYLVSASRNGTIIASERVTVDADDCHVRHESVTLIVD